jgi:hypothetical protein
MHRPQRMHPGSLPRISQLYQIGGGETKSRVGGGGDSHVVFGEKFTSDKGNVRRCVVVMQQPVLLSLNFGAKSSHYSRGRRETPE